MRREWGNIVEMLGNIDSFDDPCHSDPESEPEFPQTQTQTENLRPHIIKDTNDDDTEREDSDSDDENYALDGEDNVETESEDGDSIVGDDIHMNYEQALQECEKMDLKLDGYESDNISVVSDESEAEDNPQYRAAGACRENLFRRGREGEMIFAEGVTFSSKKQFLSVFRDFRVKEGFQVKQKKNDKIRYSAICKGENCRWKIHASIMRDKCSFMIRTYYGVHTCVKKYQNNAATSTWVAKKFGDVIRETPEISAASLKELVRREYQVEVKPQSLWRARRKALGALRAQHAADFKKLMSYAIMVDRTNPGSKIAIKKSTFDESQGAKFHRLFLSFAAQRETILAYHMRMLHHHPKNQELVELHPISQQQVLNHNMGRHYQGPSL